MRGFEIKLLIEHTDTAATSLVDTYIYIYTSKMLSMPRGVNQS